MAFLSGRRAAFAAEPLRGEVGGCGKILPSVTSQTRNTTLSEPSDRGIV